MGEVISKVLDSVLKINESNFFYFGQAFFKTINFLNRVLCDIIIMGLEIKFTKKCKDH